MNHHAYNRQPTSLHDFGKHLKLSRCIERHKIHTTISAEIASIEPVPVLKIRRRWLQAACYQHPAGMGQVWLCGGAGLARPSLGQHGANSPQTCARAPSRTENSYGYQLSCGIFLKHKQGFTLGLGPASTTYSSYTRRDQVCWEGAFHQVLSWPAFDPDKLQTGQVVSVLAFWKSKWKMVRITICYSPSSLDRRKRKRFDKRQRINGNAPTL